MTENPPKAPESRAPRPDAGPNLAAEVAATVEREPGDVVRCSHIGGNRYRCNWWSARHGVAIERGATVGLESTELRVRKSSLLVAARDGERLRLTVITGQ